jgi:Rab GDP dissociation inhibitor
MTAAELYGAYGLDAYTQEFIGHAMALFVSNDYLAQPAYGLIEALQLYSISLQSYGNSPYIYPLYGLGGMPESFSRLAAIHGGTFMLNRAVDEILFDGDGVAWGIRGGDEVAKGTMFIGDPSYFPPNKTKVTGKVVRSICICTSLPPNLGDAMSAQIIIPGPLASKQSDIYVMCVSKELEVCAGNVVVCIVSTKVDDERAADPYAELAHGIALLGQIQERFDSVADTFEPVGSGLEDRCFISKSYDDSSHFKTAAEDVLDLYERVTGTPLDLSIPVKIPQPGDY